ncbi:coiled-coil domain-containing protein 137-like [Dreissena polymorpha]|uniref:Coiled-coil domain-containing protein 137 n=1 Tax=Dreissena polymorpha TaxID=45954 RepID=A0A9D4DDM2_DREPO|nr:coiled-coil domain-containing protein 137-like [Dreissena polymorpha]KAH3747419.1 hypothetical protein DPMN_181845 [Dreissena polymorpha]
MGKLGKPQKSKKHKKLKKTFDSSAEQDLEFGLKRGKAQNLPVEDEELDMQHVPRKWKDILHAKDSGVEKKRKKKNKKNKLHLDQSQQMLPGMTRPLQKVPRFVQGKFEKDGNFMRRVEMETHRVIQRAQLEVKYKVDLTDVQNPNNLKNKRPKSERKKQKSRDKKKRKLDAQKDKKLDRLTDFSSLKDHVAFGEVAMEPPTLTAKPRMAEMDGDKARPGKKSLLLKSLLDGSQSKTGSEETTEPIVHVAVPKSHGDRKPGQTLKRKYLSPAQRQITDFQRQRAIDLYRDMRDRKYAQNNVKT